MGKRIRPGKRPQNRRRGVAGSSFGFQRKIGSRFLGGKLQAAEMPTGSLRREKQASVPSLPGFQDGSWWVQDLSAAIPAGLFHALAGKKAVDICAAPGGKTAQMIIAGAEVTAIDVPPTVLNG